MTASIDDPLASASGQFPLSPESTSYTGWRKSTYSGGGGTECVEVAVTKAKTGVRDTKARQAGMLEIPTASWSAFLNEVTADEYRS